MPPNPAIKINDYICQFSGEILELTGDVCRDNPNLRVGRCPKTGLVQLVDFSHMDIDHYEEMIYSEEENFKERQRQSGWTKKRLEYLKRYIPNLKDKSILDFGAGTGAFLEAVQPFAKRVVGFDVSSETCRLNKAQGWECYDNLQNVPHDIQILCLFHVLEHIKEPWTFLADLKSRFKYLEHFVVEVPNTNEALLTVFKSESYRKNHYGLKHLYYFNNETLALVLERAGLAIKINTQLQRYSLANHLGWMSRAKGGGQDLWPFLNDQSLNEAYEKALIEKKAADSVFIVCSV